MEEKSFDDLNDDLDDIIGILNSTKTHKGKASDIPSSTKKVISNLKQNSSEYQTTDDNSLTNEQRIQNIERMMEELELMKKKKQELVERNNRLKEIQERP